MKSSVIYWIYVPILILCACIIILFTYTSTKTISFPFSLEHSEGVLLYATKYFENGTLPYKPIIHSPYFVDNYPPVFNCLCALIRPIFHQPFAPGRFISSAALLGIALLLFLWLFAVTKRLLWSIVCGSFFLALPFIFWLVRYYRVDPLAVFFSILGSYFFIVALKKDRLWIFPIIFFVSGVYTKQSALIAPVSAVVALFFHQHKKKWFFLTTFLISLLIPAIVLNMVSNGYFLRHIFSYTITGLKLKGVASYIIRLAPLALFFALAVYFSGMYLVRKVERTIDRTFMVIYFWIAFCSLGLLFKEGASDLYMLEFTALCIVAGALGADIIFLRASRKLFVYVCVAIQTILLASFILPWVSGKNSYMKVTLNYDMLLSRLFVRENKVVSLVKNTQGRVLCEDISYPVLCGKNPEWVPFIFKQLHEKGILNDELIRRDIRAKKFDLIIFETPLVPVNGQIELKSPHIDRFTTATIQDILRNYYIIPEKSYIPAVADRMVESKTVLYPRK